MTSTFFSLSDAEAAVDKGRVSLAQGYYWLNHTQSYLPMSHRTTPVVSGGGATISTVLDYTKWLRCLMTTSPPLSPAGHSALRFPRIPQFGVPGEPTGFRGSHIYALGLAISNYRGEVMIWHSGGLPGFGTVMAFLPKLQWGVVVMANSVGGGSTVEQVLMHRLMNDLLGVPEEKRFDWEANEKKTLRQVA